MARNRIVDVVYRLKDAFTGQVAKITGGYRKMGDEAERAGKRTSAAFSNTNRILAGVSGTIAKLTGLISVGLGLRAATREVNRFSNEADRLGKVAEKLGYTSEELQRVGFAAERNGINFDTMAVAIQRATRRIAEVASTGKGEAAPALDALGLSAKQLSQLGLEERMAVLADAFANVSDQGERVRLAFKLFDTEGVDMVRVLQNGSEAFLKLTEHAGKFADILSDEAVKAATEMNDRIAEMQQRFDKFKLPYESNLIGNINNLLRDAGTYLNDQERITDQLNDAYRTRVELLEQISTVESRGRRGRGQLAQLRAELNQVTSTIRMLLDEQIAIEKVAGARAEEAAANKQAAESRKELTKERDESVKQLEERGKKVADALRKETSEFEKARREQLAIEREFQALVDKAQQPADQDLTGLDVQLKRLEAVRALAGGDADAAIAAARQGASMLEKLRAEGEESGFVLSFLAKQLQEIANQAAGQKTKAELVDVQDAELAKQRVDKALEGVKAISLDVDANSLDLMRRRIAETVEDAAATGLRAAAANWKPGVDLSSAIRQAASQRGRK